MGKVEQMALVNRCRALVLESADVPRGARAMVAQNTMQTARRLVKLLSADEQAVLAAGHRPARLSHAVVKKAFETVGELDGLPEVPADVPAVSEVPRNRIKDRAFDLYVVAHQAKFKAKVDEAAPRPEGVHLRPVLRKLAWDTWKASSESEKQYWVDKVEHRVKGVALPDDAKVDELLGATHSTPRKRQVADRDTPVKLKESEWASLGRAFVGEVCATEVHSKHMSRGSTHQPRSMATNVVRTAGLLSCSRLKKAMGFRILQHQRKTCGPIRQPGRPRALPTWKVRSELKFFGSDSRDFTTNIHLLLNAFVCLEVAMVLYRVVLGRVWVRVVFV
jgi:hypothetical protein